MEPHTATVERASDRELQVRALIALDCAHVDRAVVGVTVSCGVVTLQGRVQSRREAWLAEQAVYATPGVLGIANELHVEKDRRDRDSVLAESAVNALAGQRAVSGLGGVRGVWNALKVLQGQPAC